MIMKNLTKLLLGISLLFCQFSVNADDAAIKQAFHKIMPTTEIDSISSAVIPGLFEVMVGPKIYYMTGDGKYLLQGNIFDVEAKKDITDEKMAGARIKSINKIGLEQMIIFKPEVSKFTISVFTDIDCGYCRKLHAELDQYLAEGIAIHYLFYPRAGKGSESYKKAVSVWCAEDRNKALTLSKKGQQLPKKECDNPIDEHMRLARELGARGTPMMVTEKGAIFPGYIPAKQLKKALLMEKYN
jgi:thiol:disulfide interchange protein DsbC